MIESVAHSELDQSDLVISFENLLNIFDSESTFCSSIESSIWNSFTISISVSSSPIDTAG